MARRPLLALLLLPLLLAGCSSNGSSSDPTPTPTGAATGTSDASQTNTGPSGPPPAPVTHDIAMSGNEFVDGSITIRVGDTVRWTDMDVDTIHDVVSQSSSARFDSGDMHPLIPIMEAEFSYTFTKVGSVEYTCTYHPGTMTETITVV